MSQVSVETVSEPVASETTYRILPPEDWHVLAPVFEGYGSRLPAPEMGIIVVAERDGQIVGFLTLQPQLHVEPLWIADGHTGDVYIPKMLHQLEDTLKTLMPEGQTTVLHVFSDKPEVGRMAKACKFQHAPYHVWQKTIGG